MTSLSLSLSRSIALSVQPSHSLSPSLSLSLSLARVLALSLSHQSTSQVIQHQSPNLSLSHALFLSDGAAAAVRPAASLGNSLPGSSHATHYRSLSTPPSLSPSTLSRAPSLSQMVRQQRLGLRQVLNANGQVSGIRCRDPLDLIIWKQHQRAKSLPSV